MQIDKRGIQEFVFMCNFISVETDLHLVVNYNNRTTFLRSYSKEGFKAVKISTANISCEI